MRQKRCRERIKAIKKMSEGELLAEARRIFGKVPKVDWSLEGFREMLLRVWGEG